MAKPVVGRDPNANTRQRRKDASIQAILNALVRRGEVTRIGGRNVWTISQFIAGAYQPLDADLTAIAALTTTTFGRSLLTLADVPAAYAALDLASDVYTPTLTNVANLDASASFQAQYMRVGSVVTVSGKVTVDPTAGAATRLGISLPIASDIGAIEDVAGTAFSPGVAGQGAAIIGDATNDRAQMEWIAVNTTNQTMMYQFTYRII